MDAHLSPTAAATPLIGAAPPHRDHRRMMIRRCSRRSRRRSEDVIPAWRGDARRCAPHVHCTWPWCSRRCPRRCPRRRGVPAGSACGDESSNSGTAQRALRCKVSRSRRTCPASQLTCSRTDASPALGRRVAAWRCGGVAAWRCASRQRRVCAAEGELRVSCLRAATSERAPTVWHGRCGGGGRRRDLWRRCGAVGCRGVARFSAAGVVVAVGGQ